ncbi:MAG: hypothetical protein EZS28_029482, partial [Streblomastix strix]
GCISGEMGSNLINTEIGHIKNIQTMENEHSNIEQMRNNSDFTSIELFLANITTQPLVIPEGKAKVGLRRLVDQILLYIEEQQWEVKFRHIPGINNMEADSLSRLAVSGDYSVDKQTLQQVLEEWGIQITVDCFATRRNTKHHRYFSIESDGLAENWDGMEQPWECETPLLHCPISLIPAVIRKVELEKVKGVLIAPVWRGQVWWTALTRITICQKELGNSQDVLKEGAWMKRNNQKLPPGKIGIFWVEGERRENNYSKNAYQIQDQQDNQYKEQQMDGTEVGKRHACFLTIFAEYWAQQSGTVLHLSTLEQPYLTIANYITYLKPWESDTCIIQARNSISTLFELMGKPMNFIRDKVIEQLMKEHVDRAAKVRKEERYWKLSQLMQYISKQARLRDDNKLNSEQLMKITLKLIMVYTVLRMAEVQRAELRVDNIKEGEILIVTMTMKKPRGPVEQTLKAAQDRTVCPIRWIQSWLDKREVKGELKKEQVWRNRRKEKVWSADRCSKGVKQVLAEAGIEGYYITSIRKTSSSETIDKNMTQIQINRWGGHSDALAIVRVNYDTNNNDIIRNILEQAGKQPELNERCLLFELCPNKQGSSHQRKDCDIIRPQRGLRTTSCRKCELTCFPPRTNIRSHPINNYIVEERLNRTQLQPHWDPSTRQITITAIANALITMTTEIRNTGISMKTQISTITVAIISNAITMMIQITTIATITSNTITTMKQISTIQSKNDQALKRLYVQTLDHIIKKNYTLAPGTLRAIARQLCENLMMHCPPGSDRVIVKIADFGLVKLQEHIQQTMLMSAKGTPLNMAPELVIGDGKADAK